MFNYDDMKKFSKYIDKIEFTDPINALKQLVKSIIICVPVLTIELGRKLPLLSKQDQLSFIRLAMICNVGIFALKIILTRNIFELIGFSASTMLLGILYYFKFKDADRDNNDEDDCEDEEYEEEDEEV